ncbi:MAG: hypothetical protein JRI68_07665 [Deltaproteobacteria bacterium]|nr:hypothetical protein [Deltaproteobacteria bacterium]
MIRPTVTQKVRTFLDEQGIALRPWSGLDETYHQLHELLSRRKDDPPFWEPLSQLLQSILDDVTDPAAAQRLTAAQAELLSSWDVDELVRELRAALPSHDEALAEATHGAADPDWRPWQQLEAAASPAVLTGFLLLGLVLSGCSMAVHSAPPAPGPTPPATAAAPAPSAAPEPAAFSCTLEPAGTLHQTIQSSALSGANKELLCSCMAALDDSWDQGLTQLFETAPADTIAQALEDMLACVCPDPARRQSAYRGVAAEAGLCGSPSDEEATTNADINAAMDLPPAETEEDAMVPPLPPGPPPEPVPLYKGVSFPKG